jgi:hypothetical protein
MSSRRLVMPVFIGLVLGRPAILDRVAVTPRDVVARFMFPGFPQLALRLVAALGGAKSLCVMTRHDLLKPVTLGAVP